MNEPISVTALNQYVKGLLDRDRLLGQVYVRGEISNYKRYPSGHHYFSLKDAESSIRCVLFRREAASLRFRPENGMQVLVSGRVSVYPRDGAYQLYCDRMTPDGAGALALAFEQMKNKLYREGLFDPARKKPLPEYPAKIALVTSPAGAAVRDMIRILGVRWPQTAVLVVPVRVQGDEAPAEIAAALDLVNAMELADLIITGRGGGSMEDLWAFNEEEVARAIARSTIPVISAVGHEPDVTISDFVADRRASTPSNAAEIAVPDQEELRETLDHLYSRLDAAIDGRLRRRRDALVRLRGSPFLRSPLRAIQEKRQRLNLVWQRLDQTAGQTLRGNKRLTLDIYRRRMDHAMDRRTGGCRETMGRLAASLDAMSPFRVLGRGYAIPYTENGRVLTSVAQVRTGERLDLRLADGIVHCRTEGKEKQQWQKKS